MGMMLVAGLMPALAQVGAVPRGPEQTTILHPLQTITAAQDAPSGTLPVPISVAASGPIPRTAGFDIMAAGDKATDWDAAATESQVSSDTSGPSDEGPDADAPFVRAIPPKDYGFNTFLHHSGSIPLQLGGVALGITAVGILNWDWGSSSFHFKSEGFFGHDTDSLGLDKLGHAYSTYVITDYLTAAIRRKADRPAGNAITAGILAMGLMTYVEVFDGLSKGHGFSWEDLVADAAGMAFSVVRSSVPGLKDKLDFRLHYLPPDTESGHQQYLGQRYILALQLSGFEGLRKTPLRYVELQAGYRAEGFTAEEQLRGEKPRRIVFAGIGVNLQELLFPRPRARWQRWGRELLDYVQVPYTAIYSDQLKD